MTAVLELRGVTKTYGSLEAWPLGLGVPEDAVARLKAGLVTAVPEPDQP